MDFSPSSWPCTLPLSVFMHQPLSPSALDCFSVYYATKRTAIWRNNTYFTQLLNGLPSGRTLLKLAVVFTLKNAYLATHPAPSRRPRSRHRTDFLCSFRTTGAGVNKRESSGREKTSAWLSWRKMSGICGVLTMFYKEVRLQCALDAPVVKRWRCKDDKWFIGLYFIFTDNNSIIIIIVIYVATLLINVFEKRNTL